MSSTITLTACLIVRDEEADLPDCLRSIAFCDEVVVVDSGSDDRTREIAAAAGARVVEQRWLGFAAQRNVALEHAQGTWVLEVDADERVTAELRAEIEAFVAAPPAGVDLAGLPRREVLIGRPLGASAKYPNYCHRLLRRGAYRHDVARVVHEGLVPQGPVHPFIGELRHLYAPTWRAALQDARRYGRLETQQLSLPRGGAAVVKGAALRPLAKLGYRLIVDGGWRDGPHGAARIALDCATDASVWLRHARAGSSSSFDAGVPKSTHYGSRRSPRGSVHVAVVATTAAAARAAGEWTARAAAAGLDVVLLTPVAPAPAAGVRHRRLGGSGPFAVVRGLDAEEQLRTLDAVVAVGGRARAWTRAIPEPLRGLIPVLGPATTPDELERRVLAARAALGA